jgi:lysophospholipase L1-like esterase
MINALPDKRFYFDRSQLFIKLLIVSVVINFLGLLGGGYYVYKTRNILVNWYNAHFGNVSQTQNRNDIWKLYYEQRLNVFYFLQEDVKDKRVIIFAGDSLINTFEWAEYFADSGDAIILNRGINGDKVDGLLDRFEVTFLTRPNPAKVFIMIGINDIKKNFDLEKFLKKYDTLVEKLLAYLPPDKICIHTIFPVRREDKPPMLIKKVNEHLRAYAQTQGLCYIDLYDKFADSSGQLQEIYAHTDGIHLTPEGYKIWLEAIEPEVLDAINSPSASSH